MDPVRDLSPFTALSSKLDKPIKGAFFTHIHADFVAGHSDLLEQGLDLYFGADAHPDFKFLKMEEGKSLPLDERLAMRAILTPGHTPDSACFVLAEGEKSLAVFTGDTLFIRSVGRPDLASNAKLTKEDMSAMLYDSLQKLTAALPDDVMVLPAHGAGSLCGAGMCSTDTTSTIGQEKASNQMLALDKPEFIATNTRALFTPKYFFQDVAMNNQKNVGIKEFIGSLKEVSAEMLKAGDCLLVDVRPVAAISEGYLEGSVAVTSGLIETWGAKLYGPGDKLTLIIGSQSELVSAVTKFCRIGLESTIKGFFPFPKAKDCGLKVDRIEQVDPASLKGHEDKTFFVDVRAPNEVEKGHMAVFTNYPIDVIIQDYLAKKQERVAELRQRGAVLSHCQAGARSIFAGSLLKLQGLGGIKSVAGGMSKMVEAGLATVK